MSVLIVLSALLGACATHTQPPVEIGQADRLGMALVGPEPPVETFGSVHSEVSETYRRNLLYGLLYAPMTLGTSIFMAPAFGHADAKDVRACLEPYFQRRPELVQDLAAAGRREQPHEEEILDEFARIWRAIYPGGGTIEKIAGGANRDAVLGEAGAHRIDELFEISLKRLAVEYEYPCAIEARVDLELSVTRVAGRNALLRKSLEVRSRLVGGPDDMETLLTVPGKLKQEYLSTIGQAFGDFFHNCDSSRSCGPPYPLDVAERPEK